MSWAPSWEGHKYLPRVPGSVLQLLWHGVAIIYEVGSGLVLCGFFPTDKAPCLLSTYIFVKLGDMHMIHG